MAKFFKNVKCGVIEEVENKDVIRMMEESDVYEEVEDPAKAKAKAKKEEAPAEESSKEETAEAEAPKAEPKAKK